MDFRTADYNGAAETFQTVGAEVWRELTAIVAAMPLHVKESDEARRLGQNIFDPVGTNAAFYTALSALPNWRAGIPMPAEFSFLGTGIDFGRDGVLLEVQFSNYPIPSEQSSPISAHLQRS